MAKQLKNHQQNMYNNFYSVTPTSEFDGKLGGLIGRTVVAFLAGLFALAIFAAPLLLGVLEVIELSPVVLVVGGVLAAFGFFFSWAWFSNIRQRWFVKHTRVNGYRLKFTGKTWNLTFNMIKWFFLSIITIFIYALWLPIKVKQWRTNHTIIDENAPVMEMQTFYNAPAQQLALNAAYQPGYYAYPILK